MKRFMAFATSALTLSALLGLAISSHAASILELRPVVSNDDFDASPTAGGAYDANESGKFQFQMDLYYTPDATLSATRTTVISSYLLFDDTKFDVTFATTLTIAPGTTNRTGRPTLAQRNALAPTRNQITVLTVGGGRDLSSFNTPVDILGSNPSGLVTTNALFDGDYNIPAGGQNPAIPGLIFPSGGFIVGRYTFALRNDGAAYNGTYGETVVGLADALLTTGQTLTGEEAARVETNLDPDPALTIGAGAVRRFAVVPAPSSVAVMALGGLMPMIAIARRRRAAK